MLVTDKQTAGFFSRFVSYDSAVSAESAIQGLNNVLIGGRRLKVTLTSSKHL